MRIFTEREIRARIDKIETHLARLYAAGMLSQKDVDMNLRDLAAWAVEARRRLREANH